MTEITKTPGTKEQLLGPDYPYYKYIKPPKDIGMSDKGSLKQMGKNVDGLVSYVELLVSGKSKASATGQPLGNKFFLNTTGKCKDNKMGTEKDRYIYVNNVPSGNIPFISSGMGVNFSEFKGLVPGLMSNVNAFNPMSLMNAFFTGATPECQEITMETIDTENKKSTETHFVSLIDIKNMDPCSFQNKTNPLTKQKCVNTFTNMNQTQILDTNNYACVSQKVPDDLFAKAYVTSLSCFGVYIAYRAMVKFQLVPEL